MSDDKKKAPSFPDLDLAGPAALGDEPPRREARAAARRMRGRAGTEPGRKADDKNGAKKKVKAPKTKPKRGLFLRFIIWLFWTGLGLGVAGLVVAVGGYYYLNQELPSTDGLNKNYAPPTVTYFYSDDGRVIGEYSHERRFVVSIDDIPDRVKHAFIALEDAEFYTHKGVNPKAIIRAGLANFMADGVVQGASTITQQVIKTFLLTPEQSYKRKAKEIILALRIEKNLSKEEILHLYLNQIFMGENAYGVEAAALTYFGKHVQELSIAEAAMLAGIPKAPSTNNPVKNPLRARERQLYCIERMKEVGYITEAEAMAAKHETIVIRDKWPNVNTTVTPYFTEHVRRLMEERVGEQSLYNDGWKVYTTVNIEAQHGADKAAAQGLLEYGRRRGYRGPVTHLEHEDQIAGFIAEIDKKLPGSGPEDGQLYQALITDVDSKDSSLDVMLGSRPGRIEKKHLVWALKKGVALNKTFNQGDVVWVRLDKAAFDKQQENGKDMADMVATDAPRRPLPLILERRTDVQSALLSMDLSNGDVKAMVGGRDFGESQFNRATQSQRQPGSSFKPILYASALDNGFTPGSVMIDAPVVIDDRGSGKRWKPVNSDLKFKGPMTLYTALVGSRNLISIKLLDRIGYEALAKTAADLGITEKLPESLTISLGAHGIKMPELITAYSAFANMGVRVTPRYITRIEDRNGNVVASFEPEHTQSLDPGTACAVTWMLRGVVAHGTGGSVKAINRPVAGKTGTTNDYSDAWFVGFTPELVTAVWVGTDQQRPRAVGEVGGRVAGPIFLYYMQEALKDQEVRDFVVPEGAELVNDGSPFGVCYKAGTIGTGISETIASTDAEDSFLREDFENAEGGEQVISTDGGFYGTDYENSYDGGWSEVWSNEGRAYQGERAEEPEAQNPFAPQPSEGQPVQNGPQENSPPASGFTPPVSTPGSQTLPGGGVQAPPSTAPPAETGSILMSTTENQEAQPAPIDAPQNNGQGLDGGLSPSPRPGQPLPNYGGEMDMGDYGGMNNPTRCPTAGEPTRSFDGRNYSNQPYQGGSARPGQEYDPSVFDEDDYLRSGSGN